VLVIAALAVAAVWYLAVRPKETGAPARWDPRVAILAGFVQHQQALAWKHPVRVAMLTATGFADRFGPQVARAPRRPLLAGANVARYSPGDHTVYVAGGLTDLYAEVGVVGQLAEALHDQYPGRGSRAAADLDAAGAQAAFVRGLTPIEARDLRAQELRGR
jgi:hypothetical protein